MFVVSTSGTFDEAEVIEELKNIIRSRIPVFIVTTTKMAVRFASLKEHYPNTNKHVVDVVDEHHLYSSFSCSQTVPNSLARALTKHHNMGA